MRTPAKSFLLLAMAFVASAAMANTCLATDESKSEVGSRWGSFRNGGSSRVVDSAELPIEWTEEKGVAWQSELPGYGQSSPVIWGDKIFVTAVEGDEKDQNLLVCVGRKDGNEIWRISQATTLKGPSNYMFSRAAPTPVVDNRSVFAFYESGDLIAANINDGKTEWKLDLKSVLGEIKSRHGLGSSLAQTEDHLLVNVEHDGPSALLAIEKRTGKISWKKDRPSGSSWSSPVVMQMGDENHVVLSSAGEVVAWNAATGEQVWRMDGLAGNSVASPLVVDRSVYLGARKPEFGNAEKAAKSNLCLVVGKGIEQPEVAWRSKRCLTDYASPVACGDFLYIVDGNGILGCLDKASGKEMYRQRLGFKCWATPVVWRDHVFFFGKNGQALVVKAGSKFEKVSENRLWDPTTPPVPVSYKEYYPKRAKGGHGGGHPGGGGHSGAQEGGHKGGATAEKPAKPGERMLQGLLKNDANQDGVLSGDEIPKRLLGVLENIDLNKDGQLDKQELGKMAASFAARRSGSRDSSRDPIVYGVAADSVGIVIRTGTRLYSVEKEGEDVTE